MREMPSRIAALPRDQRGYPVPWFVCVVDGVPDFRVVDGRKVVRAVSERRCFICGDVLGRHLAFVIGPMCAVNRVSSEPPSHRDCAVFAAQTCPFLANPEAPRRSTHMPEEATEPAGIPILRNPGVTLVWGTRSYEVERVDPGQGKGIIFRVGEPEECLWFTEGRAATRTEVMTALESGYPRLYELTNCSEDVAVLRDQYALALQLLPAGPVEGRDAG
jgi:hypothetical protein